MSSYKKPIIFLLIGLSLAALFLSLDLDEISKLFLLALFCIFALAGFKPKLGLFILIIARPCLDILTNKPIIITNSFNLNLASLFAISVIIFSAVILIKYLPKINTLPLKYNWLAFIIIVLFSAFLSYNHYLSLAESLRLLSILAIYYLSYFLLKNERDLRNLIKAIIASALIPSFFALWQFYTDTGLTVPFEGIYNRIYGTFAHPNLLAYYLVLPLILSLFLFLSGKRKQINSLVYFLLSIFLVIILTLTFTRGAWLSFIIIILIIGTLYYRSLLFASLIFMALAYFLIGPINSRVNDLISNRSDSSIEWRLNLWHDAKEYIKEKPLLGYGTGVANDLILTRRGEEFGSSDPHNDYLKITIENGLIGLLAYGLLLIGLISRLIKEYLNVNRTQIKTLIIIAIGLSTAFFTMSAADNILRNTALMWSFWALMGAIFMIENKTEKAPSSRLQ